MMNDNLILNKLENLNNLLNSNTINLLNIKKEIEALNKNKYFYIYEYLQSLLDPIRRKGVKIPSNITPPSASFQFHTTFDITSNRYGNFLVAFNPYYLYNNIDDNVSYETGSDEIVMNTLQYTTTFGWSNVSTLDGSTVPFINMYRGNIGQGIPGIYSSYRLVSSCINIKYIDEIMLAQGSFCGGISFEKYKGPGGVLEQVNGAGSRSTAYSVPSAFNEYADFSLLEHLSGFKRRSCLEGLDLLYYPLDNSYLEYQKLQRPFKLIEEQNDIEDKLNFFKLQLPGKYPSGFTFICCADNCPPQRRFLVELYSNFECLVEPSVMDYIPVSKANVNIGNTEALKIAWMIKDYDEPKENLYKIINKLLFNK